MAGVAASPMLAAAQPKEPPLAEGRRTLSAQGERYGTLPDDHPTTVRVRDIFERLVRAAGRRPGLLLEAHVLDTPKIVAEALRGGIVTMSRGAVDLARGDDNALAFLLGHEVAHLLRGHHALLESLGVLGAGAGADRTPRSEDVVRAYHAVELDADRLGVLYAALAGYRTTPAVPVLTALVERSGPDALHPVPRARAAAMRDQIAAVSDHLDVFHCGLFLLGTGRYLEAAGVLEHFLAVFPSREVLGAVGVAYHREALRYAPAAPFRHALIVDGVTRASAVKGAGAHPAFRQFLDRAVHYYTLAIDADPGYAPAVNNLAAAYLDLNERDLALGHVGRALKLSPRLAAAHNNRGVVWAHAQDWTLAEQDWLTAARLDATMTAPAHNLAALYDGRGRAEEARRWSARLQATRGEPKTAERIGAVVPGAPLVGLREWLGEAGVRALKIPRGAQVGADLTLFVLSRRGLVVLAREQAVAAVGARAEATVATGAGVRPGDTSAHVESVYGRPGGVDEFQALGLVGYPARALALFVVNGRVQSIWAGRPAGAAP